MSESFDEVIKHLPGQHTQGSHGRRAAGGVGAANDATNVSSKRQRGKTKRGAAARVAEAKRQQAELAKQPENEVEYGTKKSDFIVRDKLEYGGGMEQVIDAKTADGRDVNIARYDNDHVTVREGKFTNPGMQQNLPISSPDYVAYSSGVGTGEKLVNKYPMKDIGIRRKKGSENWKAREYDKYDLIIPM